MKASSLVAKWLFRKEWKLHFHGKERTFFPVIVSFQIFAKFRLVDHREEQFHVVID